MSTSRLARAVWEGDLQSGKGTVTAVSSQAFGDLAVTWKARAESANGKTSPEELIAAAHATCFSMALSNVLAGGGHAPTRLQVQATVTFDPMKPKIESSRLELTATVPGIDQQAFQEAAEKAKVGCPVSQALAGNIAIDLEAKLEG